MRPPFRPTPILKFNNEGGVSAVLSVFDWVGTLSDETLRTFETGDDK